MPPRPKTPAGPTPVEATIHADKRANIPTANAHDLITPDIEKVVTVSCPREIHSPMLVWQGKEARPHSDTVVVLAAGPRVQSHGRSTFHRDGRGRYRAPPSSYLGQGHRPTPGR